MFLKIEAIELLPVFLEGGTHLQSYFIFKEKMWSVPCI